MSSLHHRVSGIQVCAAGRDMKCTGGERLEGVQTPSLDGPGSSQTSQDLEKFGFFFP